jgi:hypothetical protein
VKIEIIDVAVFGAETLVSAFVRSYDGSGGDTSTSSPGRAWSVWRKRWASRGARPREVARVDLSSTPNG